MLINLTPHVINLLPDGRDPIILHPGDQPARCSEITSNDGIASGVPLVRKEYGAVTGLPEPEDGVLYVVSALVRMALPERKDLASPGDLVRDESGKPVGCRNLVVN